MPVQIPRPCRAPGCRKVTVTRHGYCKNHTSLAARRSTDGRRGTTAQRGYGHRWQKARAAYLAAHPLCVACQAAGRVQPATVVDHIVPHRLDPVLMWDQGNWQPLCKPCHDRKTMGELNAQR